MFKSSKISLALLLASTGAVRLRSQSQLPGLPAALPDVIPAEVPVAVPAEVPAAVPTEVPVAVPTDVAALVAGTPAVADNLKAAV